MPIAHRTISTFQRPDPHLPHLPGNRQQRRKATEAIAKVAQQNEQLDQAAVDNIDTSKRQAEPGVGADGGYRWGSFSAS
ncbi:hypothetical protein [Pseudomonas sp.]|uniref:hypothetical protein n=1 Tax=Pseudomonas sp. TaxID=306 RepID=UPI0031DB26B1